MSVFTISDLHLSTLASTNKSMEVFGRRWENYQDRIEKNWRRLVRDCDTVVIPGDISWALSLDEALSDLKFIDSLPGRKILGKGNHDFWWSTMRKHTQFFEKNKISTISFLYNNAYEADNIIIAGTRGWYYEESTANAPAGVDFDKLVARESGRLKMSLNEAVKLRGGTEREIVVFMHFPPYWNETESEATMAILEEYGIKRVFFGHIHGNYSVPSRFEYKNIEMSLISADFTEFTPKIV